MQSVGQLRGMRSQRSIRDPTAWERANYIIMLASYPDQVYTEANLLAGRSPPTDLLRPLLAGRRGLGRCWRRPTGHTR
jgi:hypothetical protein